MTELTPRLVLNHLIETCRDSERGYRAAAGLVEGLLLKTTLLDMADERARFARGLVPHAQRLGGDGPKEGTLAAALHRQWMDFKARLSPHNDRVVFAEVLRGDEVTLRTYERAVQELLPTTVRDVVEEQEKGVRDMHARLRRLEPEIETRAIVTGVPPEVEVVVRSTPGVSIDKSSEPATSSRVAEWLVATGRTGRRAK